MLENFQRECLSVSVVAMKPHNQKQVGEIRNIQLSLLHWCSLPKE